MNRFALGLVGLVMLAAGAAIRVNNAMVFPPLSAYDGFSHFSYIWFMAEEWRVPLATTGWEFFQPPLYYAFMAAVWDGLAPMDPVLRLRIGTLVIALLGLSLAAVSFDIVRREMPTNRTAQLVAPALMLFLPVHLYTAGFLGNENLTAVTCAWALFATLAALRAPTVARAIVLGMALGLAMLTKFTGLVVVVGAFGAFGLRAFLRDTRRADLRVVAISAAVMLLLCGWFYGRNVLTYGTPFKMSRETFLLQRYEHIQTRGQRGLLEYVLFDPMILRRPEWPRSVPLAGDRYPGVPYSAMRESVLTGLYANTWFDGYGGWVFPKISSDERVRRAGQLLLTLGLIPTLLMAIGIAWAVRRLRREGWNDTIVVMLFTFGAMMIVLVQGTHSVPIHAAVKATYLTPVSVVFGVWLAYGLDWLAVRRPRWLAGTAMLCGVTFFVSAAVFLQGHLIAPTFIQLWRDWPQWQNAYGVVYHAGGDRERAREWFEQSAAGGYHLGYENLAVLTLEDDRPLEALHYLRDALRVQPRQTFGTPGDQFLFNLLTRAEYLNTMAVIYQELGWDRAALAAAKEAVSDDPALPEAAYDLAVLKLTAVTARPPCADGRRRALVAQSRLLLRSALELDPAFYEARRLTATLAALEGDCETAAAALAEAQARRGELRRYPVHTGVGDLHAAAVRRRRHIQRLPDALQPEMQVQRCREEQAEHAT
jgi:tetratricopeptide (TPR) repeat protein